MCVCVCVLYKHKCIHIHAHTHIGTVYVDRLEEESDKEAVKPKLQELAKAYKDANNGDVGAPDLKF